MYAQHDRPDEAQEFGDLCARYRPRLVAYCRRRLENPADAEDAAHEALLRAFQAWARYDRALDAWPWLATIAARVCADVRRRSARFGAPSPDRAAADVHELAVGRLRASIIEDALAGLPARHRNPLLLKEFAGWSYRDIARLEGGSVASVRSNIMRSRRYLGAKVEAVARTRGQWPLPVAVPSVARGLRDRLRHWRQGVVRTFDRTMLVTGLALAVHPVAAVAAPAVAAAVAVAGTAVAADVTGTSATGSNASGAAVSVRLSSGALSPIVPPPVARAVDQAGRVVREPLAGVSRPISTVGDVTVGADVMVEATSEAIYLRAQVWAETPEGSRRHGTQPNVACQVTPTHREACGTVADTLRPLPDH